jgi:hypothetical protein
MSDKVPGKMRASVQHDIFSVAQPAVPVLVSIKHVITDVWALLRGRC